MAVEDRVERIPVVLQALRETEPPAGRVLSAHLDTSVAASLGPAYVIAFRDLCQGVRADLEGADRPERKRFEAAVAQAEGFLAHRFVPSHPGLALFASGEPTYFFAVPLPLRPTERVTWGERPAIEPLQEALDEFERIAVLLFDKERTRLFTIFLGEIEERHVLWDEVPGKQATGDWFGLSQARYARHHEDHVLRHAKRAIAALTNELRTHPFDRLVIGGSDEAVSLLKHHLPRPLRTRLAGTVSLELFASDAEVRDAALAVAAAIERREDAAAVRELVDAATTPHAVLGLAPTLAALSDGRVHRLFVADTLAAGGAECTRCGRLTAEGGPCPACGGATEPLADARERAVERAMDQGARVELVSGEAAALLVGHGGLGAWTRY